MTRRPMPENVWQEKDSTCSGHLSGEDLSWSRVSVDTICVPACMLPPQRNAAGERRVDTAAIFLSRDTCPGPLRQRLSKTPARFDNFPDWKSRRQRKAGALIEGITRLAVDSSSGCSHCFRRMKSLQEFEYLK